MYKACKYVLKGQYFERWIEFCFLIEETPLAYTYYSEIRHVIFLFAHASFACRPWYNKSFTTVPTFDSRTKHLGIPVIIRDLAPDFHPSPRYDTCAIVVLGLFPYLIHFLYIIFCKAYVFYCLATSSYFKSFRNTVQL